MFRAEVYQFTHGATLKLEGRFVGDWVGVAKSISPELLSKELTVDLTDLTYVDSAGSKSLARLQGSTCFGSMPQRESLMPMVTVPRFRIETRVTRHRFLGPIS